MGEEGWLAEGKGRERVGRGGRGMVICDRKLFFSGFASQHHAPSSFFCFFPGGRPRPFLVPSAVGLTAAAALFAVFMKGEAEAFFAGDAGAAGAAAAAASDLAGRPRFFAGEAEPAVGAAGLAVAAGLAAAVGLAAAAFAGDLDGDLEGRPRFLAGEAEPEVEPSDCK